MDSGKFMKGTRRGDIQKLHVRVFSRIALGRRMVEENGIEFQTLCIFHREDHDSFGEFGCLRIGIGKLQFSAKRCTYRSGFLLIPADHGNRLPAV